jgi:hypothetical protein
MLQCDENRLPEGSIFFTMPPFAMFITGEAATVKHS